MDDATSELYSAFLVEEEGTASTFRALKEVFTDQGLPGALYSDRGSHYFHTPKAGDAAHLTPPPSRSESISAASLPEIYSLRAFTESRARRA